MVYKILRKFDIITFRICLPYL